MRVAADGAGSTCPSSISRSSSSGVIEKIQSSYERGDPWKKIASGRRGRSRGRLEAPHELTVLVGEELRPPLAGVDELLSDLVLRLGHSLEEAGVPVAHHVPATELADSGKRLGWLRANGDVTETDDLVDVRFCDLGEDRVEREPVAVDVGDERYAHVGPEVSAQSCR